MREILVRRGRTAWIVARPFRARLHGDPVADRGQLAAAGGLVAELSGELGPGLATVGVDGIGAAVLDRDSTEDELALGSVLLEMFVPTEFGQGQRRSPSVKARTNPPARGSGT